MESTTLSLLSDCLVGFSTDPQANIDRIANTLGRLFKADCALFSVLEADQLRVVGSWQAPSDMQLIDRAEGHLCTDVIRRADGEPFIVRDLQRTRYRETDPNVGTYALCTYVGQAVSCRGASVGSLCVVFQRDFVPTAEDLETLKILAWAAAVEEEHRTAGESLRASEEKYRALVEGTSDLVYAVSPNGIVDYISPQIARYGYAEADLLGRSLMDFALPEDAPLLAGKLAEAVRTGGRLASEFRSRSRDGEIRWFHGSGTPTRGPQGTITGVIGVLADITEHQRAEAAMVTVQKLESLGTMAGGIAHDFNNMLTGILGNLSLVKEDPGTGGEMLELLQEAEEACVAAKGLARQLLTFASGGNPIVEPHDLGQLLRQAAAFAVRGSGARCEFQIATGPLFTRIDKDQISQVAQNLVINAVQAMPIGGTILVEAAPVVVGLGELPPLSAGPYVRVAIADQGTGIPPDYLSRVFDPYFSTKGKGRGLGLATSHSIIKKHGGHIGVRSRPGMGTTMVFHLPVCDPGDSSAGQAEQLIRASGRILVMDDDKVVARVLGRMLERLGCTVVIVSGGQQALDAWVAARKNDTPFAAAIMDVTIPGGMGGKQAVRQLRELDSKALCIVSSGYANDPILSEWWQHGFVGVLPKPYRLEDVSAVLRRVSVAEPVG